MNYDFSRRGFIGALLSSAACGCASSGKYWFGEAPRLKMGVISDIHITTPESADRFRLALAHFRDLGADAIIVSGDLTDWGLKSSLRYMADVWNEVFPGDRGANGEKVARLFVTGNHDLDGWLYGDMTLDMHTQGYSEEEALSKLGIEKCWEEIFGERYEKIRLINVKGYDFVCAHWNNSDDKVIAEWFKENGSKIKKGKPFFFTRHCPIHGTEPRLPQMNGLTEALKAHPDCIAFTGHTHRNLFDERSIWQGGFTAVTVPSMSYSSVPGGYENGSGSRTGTSNQGMERIDARERLLQPQGFFVEIFERKAVINRFDFTRMANVAEPWVIPTGEGRSEPYTREKRFASLPVPQFAEGAELKTYVTNSDTRNARWRIFMTLEFPAANVDGVRAYDYEARVEFSAGGTGAIKRFLSPGFYRPADEEDKIMRFRFDCMDLPEYGKYRFRVYPRNCFGAYGRPIESREYESKPGLSKAKR
jgi:predicted phosphodiesterase